PMASACGPKPACSALQIPFWPPRRELTRAPHEPYSRCEGHVVVPEPADGVRVGGTELPPAGRGDAARLQGGARLEGRRAARCASARQLVGYLQRSGPGQPA